MGIILKIFRIRLLKVIISAIIGLLLVGSAWADFPPWQISLDSKLLDPEGNPSLDPRQVTRLHFKLYGSANGDDLLWDSWRSYRMLPRSEGKITYTFGADGEEIPAHLTFDRPYWLEIQIGRAEIFSPRIPLTSVPYAFVVKADSS